jgi:hypothetical protein
MAVYQEYPWYSFLQRFGEMERPVTTQGSESETFRFIVDIQQTYRPQGPITGTALLVYMHKIFVPDMNRPYRSSQPVMVIVLLFYM